MKTAFILSGGGVKGAFQVGAMKAVIEAGIVPDACYGTSIGALNSAAMAFHSIYEIEKFWRAITKMSDALSTQWFSLLSAGGYYSTAPLKKTLNKIISGTPTREAVACYCDLWQGSKNYAYLSKMKIEDFRKFLLASASIPTAMNPVDDRYVDGGVREQTPIKPAIDDGMERIIIFLCNPFEVNLLPESASTFPKILNNGLRALDMMEHQIFLNDINTCLIRNDLPDYRHVELLIISPEAFLYDTLTFDPKLIAGAIDKGYAQAKFLLTGSGIKP